MIRTEATDVLAPIPAGAGSVLAAMHAATGAPSVPAPFSEPILLVERTRIARVRLAAGPHDLPATGDELRFERVPSDPNDHWTIDVYETSGRALGKVAADVNQILARLMDAGKHVYGKVFEVHDASPRPVIWMEVYLDD